MSKSRSSTSRRSSGVARRKAAKSPWGSSTTLANCAIPMPRASLTTSATSSCRVLSGDPPAAAALLERHRACTDTHAGAALLRAQELGRAGDPEPPGAGGELERDAGHGIRRGVVAAQPALGARARARRRRGRSRSASSRLVLPDAGGAVDEEEPLGRERVDVDDDPVGERPEGLDLEPVHPHAAPADAGPARPRRRRPGGPPGWPRRPRRAAPARRRWHRARRARGRGSRSRPRRRSRWRPARRTAAAARWRPAGRSAARGCAGSGGAPAPSPRAGAAGR